MSLPRLALATSREESSLSTDDRLLLPALNDVGIEALIVIWSDVDPSDDIGAMLIRSAWDYHLHSAEFVRWVRRFERAGIPVWNGSRIVEWNADKRYLFDLERRGITIPRTALIESIDDPLPPDLLSRPIVVKPVVSAGAYRTVRLDHPTDGRLTQELGHILDHGPALVQELMPEVITVGEYSFMFIDGSFSHAVLKRPTENDFRVQEEYGGTIVPVTPLPSMIEQATFVAQSAYPDALYARVDAVFRDDRLYLMELELIEPSLFFRSDGDAAQRLARACRSRMNGHA